MSLAGPPHEIPEVIRGLIDRWTSGLAQVVESMADQKPEIRWQPGGEPAPGHELQWWEQPFPFAPEMLFWVATPRPTWEFAGTLTLKAAGLETVETAEARNTWLEILGQSLSGVATAMGQVLGREVMCGPGAERPPEAIPQLCAMVELNFGDTILPPVWLGIAPKLAAAICNPTAGGEPETSGGERVQPTGAITAEIPPTMDLLLDVELPVSISFGKTEILMKDVLKLTTGSIVELNRGVNEPVEVLVNHCLIARGEVVVVEGNYGVRIQQIVNRQDRLRSIR
jgi:flagellar motor switch protein FliN/FliY